MNEILYDMSNLEYQFLPQGHHIQAGFHEVLDPLVCIVKGDLTEDVSTQGDLTFTSVFIN